MKLETAHLSYEHGFVSIIVPDGDDIDCGRIREDGLRTMRYWSFEIGDMPDWFDEEFDDLRKQVRAEHERLTQEDRDYRSQVNADYRRGNGTK